MKINIKKGSRRIVFLIGNKVYKIPNILGWVSFIRGIEENLEERYWWSADGSRKREPKRKWSYDLPLAEIHYADRFGFLLIMERLETDFFIDENTISFNRRYKVLEDLQRLKERVQGFQFANDIKFSNIGYKGDKLLLLDYGYFGGTRDCYIGT